MRILEYLIPEDADGMSVKDYARLRLGFSVRVLAEQKRTENGVTVNGAPCRVTRLLHAGDVLRFSLPQEQSDYPAAAVPLSVLWETEDYLVVEKPWGMPIHPSPGHDMDSLLNAAAYHYRQTGQTCLFRPLYRLDKDTSGVVVIAKHRAAAQAQTEKRYLAVCEGVFSGEGAVDLPIGLKADSKIVRECGHGDPAVTHWRALCSCGGHTAVALSLETGRTHQIRVHMAHLGHPLAGDDLYGGSLNIIKRQALHCFSAVLSCPALDLQKRSISEIAPDLREAFPWLPRTEELIKEGPTCHHA